MIGSLIPLISKIVIFGIDTFVKNQIKREKLKREFEGFVAKYDQDMKQNAAMHKKYKEMRKRFERNKKL